MKWLLLLCAGCGMTYTDAVKAETLMATTMTASIKTYDTYDAQKQLAIAHAAPTEDAKKEALDSYAATEQATMLKVESGMSVALQTLDAALSTWKLTGQGNLAAAVATASAAILDATTKIALLIAGKAVP